MVVKGRHQGVDIIAQVLGKKLAFLLIGKIHVAHLYTLFLRTPVVVLGLHLHELQTTDTIGTETDLLAVGVPILVLAVHIEARCIKVGRVILQITPAIDVLHELICVGHLQQLVKLIEVGDELRISTVHQLHTAHLFQRNGVKM